MRSPNASRIAGRYLAARFRPLHLRGSGRNKGWEVTVEDAGGVHPEPDPDWYLEGTLRRSDEGPDIPYLATVGADERRGLHVIYVEWPRGTHGEDGKQLETVLTHTLMDHDREAANPSPLGRSSAEERRALDPDVGGSNPPAPTTHCPVRSGPHRRRSTRRPQLRP